MNYEAELSSKMKDVLFGDIVELITYKVNASEISLNNYISTDNMLPNCGGVTHASSLPSANKFNAFTETDTLFSNIRTYFRKVWFAGFSGGASPDVLIFRSKDKSFLDPHFLYYLISNKTFIDYTDLTSKGAKMPRGDKDAIAKFPVKLPSMNEQKSIVSVLGPLDDKIENNRRMNETLEEMARAIFKSWFVDFDPVHAKAAGNAPAHMDAETAALFPSSFGDDGLPVGWINKTLGDFIEIQNGYAFKSKDWTDEGVPVVKIGSVKPSIVDLSNCSFVSAEVAEQKRNFQLKVGDILIGLTGYVGEVGRVPPADKMPMLNQRVGRVVFKRESFEPFVYAAMRLPEFKSFAESQSHGSAQANVSTKQLQEYPVVVADNLLIQKFNEVLESNFEKILTNSAENKTLAELRDTLLPKLMSGEIRVKDAEREVEAAV